MCYFTPLKHCAEAIQLSRVLHKALVPLRIVFATILMKLLAHSYRGNLRVLSHTISVIFKAFFTTLTLDTSFARDANGTSFVKIALNLF